MSSGPEPTCSIFWLLDHVRGLRPPESLRLSLLNPCLSSPARVKDTSDEDPVQIFSARALTLNASFFLHCKVFLLLYIADGIASCKVFFHFQFAADKRSIHRVMWLILGMLRLMVEQGTEQGFFYDARPQFCAEAHVKVFLL